MVFRFYLAELRKELLVITLLSTSLIVFAQNDKLVLENDKSKQRIESIYPLKSQSLIYTEEEVAVAKNKISNIDNARKLAQTIVQSAEKWVEWDDQELRALIPDGSVPRSFDLNAEGCPVHGDTIFHVGGAYPWILDPEKQFKVECPVGHEVYPANEFTPSEVWKEGQDQKSGKPYVDNGWGWNSENGETYWFVAYANQWFYIKYVQEALRNLGRAYVLTDRPEFAHKALVMLHRLAEVYPGMDYEHQSRYGQLLKQNGGRYPGKVLNRIWETTFIQTAAECYDAVWNHIEKDYELQEHLDMGGEEIQAFVEVNLLEEAVDAYRDRKIQGNFGMHQMALLYVLLARQHMDNDRYINQIIHNVSKEYLHTGISYALYNYVFRDGVPMESPSYNFLWIRTLAALNDRLKKFGVDFFEDHRFQSVLKSPIHTMGTDQYTIDVGDSGSTLGGVLGRDLNTYEVAFLNTGDSTFLSWLYPDGKRRNPGDRKFTYESLFRPEVDILDLSGAVSIDYSTSRLLAGYGLGKLAAGGDNPNTVAMTYSLHGSHYHWDFLNFELFAFGQKMMPDFGYPDAMNAYVPGVFTWSQNTVSHNTVVVDAHKQNRNVPGVLHNFTDGRFARTMGASTPAYSQVSRYRRNLVSVDAGNDHNYLVDFFYVKGGHRHDYILHGPPGYVEVEKAEWSQPKPGTYAGEDVDIAEIYDHPEMNTPDYSGGYSRYGGSGFQHLFNVQKKINGSGIVDFQHLNDPQARLKLRVLENDRQDLYIADAYNHPRSKEFLIKHLISHSEDASSILDNTFVSVIEPYYREDFIQSAGKLSVSGGIGSQAVYVNRGTETDIVISDFEQVGKTIDSFGIQTDATAGVVTLDEEGRLKRVFFSDGKYLSYGDQRFEARPLTGKVSGIDIDQRQVTIRLDKDQPQPDLKELNTDVLFFRNGDLQTAHPISQYQLEGDNLTLTTTDDLLIGRINVTKLAGENQAVQINNSLRFASSYIGAYVLNESYEVVGKVTSISGNKLSYSGNAADIFGRGETADVWIATIGVGDDAEWKTRLQWESDE